VEAQRFRYTVSTELPIAGTGAEGDFWFQIQPSA
jgi:hypothetical protein